MKYLIVLLSLFVSNTTTVAKPIDICGRNPIFCQIVKNHPDIDKGYAMKLSTVISNVSKEFRLDARLVTAILAQESKYDVSKKLCNARYCTDFGIAQINWRTADVFQFDRNLLTSDLEYSIKAGAMVLAEIKGRYAHKEKDYWTRYNAVTPSKRHEYKQLVARYM